MPAQISGAYADVTMLNRAFTDWAPSSNSYAGQVAYVGPMGIKNFSLDLWRSILASKTEVELSTLILGNMGLLPNTPLRDAVADYLVAVGKENIGVVTVQLGRILSGLENATGDMAIYAPAAVRWNNELNASHIYSSNPAHQVHAIIFPVMGVGVTLGLTSGDDVVYLQAAQPQSRATADDDTIVAPIPGMLGSGDVIIAGDVIDVDVLKATLGPADSVAPILQGIEKVFITAGPGGQLDIGRSSGIKELWMESAAGAAAFMGVSERINVGIRDSLAGGPLTVGYADTSGASDTAYLVFADATGADEVIIAGVENIKIRSETGGVAGTAINSARITAESAEQIVITGGQGLNTTVTGARVAVIDATYMTGALGLTFATTGAVAVGIAGGSGADTFIINDASGARVVIEAGSGADTLTIGGGNAHRIVLGGGVDVLSIGGLAGTAARDLDINTAAALGRSAIEVTDFVSGTDAINLTGATATAKAATNSSQLESIAASSSLLAAATLAATTAGANKAIAFRYGADTYILVNDGAAALGENDSLVKLSGVTALADASWTVA